MRTGIGGSNRGRCTLVGAALGALATSTAHAETITVDTTVPGVATDGHCSLAEAIQAANTDAAVDTCAAGLGADEIHLAAATYEFLQAFDGSDSHTALPAIASKVSIVGTAAATTILKFNAVASNVQFFKVTSLGQLTLKHLTLSDGYGAASIYGGSLVLDDCIVSRNHGGVASGENPVIYAQDGASVAIKNSQFKANFSPSIELVYGSKGTVESTSFVANKGTPIISATDLTVVGCTFDQNENDGSQISGIAIQAGKLKLERSTFTNNISRAAVLHTVGDATVTECTFSGNHGGDEGSTIRVGGPTTIDRTLMEGNEAIRGGALQIGYPGSSLVTIKNSTITGNKASEDGGGIWSDSAMNVVLNNVTVANNAATRYGGGIAIQANGSLGTFRLANTIVAANADGDGGHTDCAAYSGKFLISDGYNLVGSNVGCAIVNATGDQIGTPQALIDPKLAPLADNGGPTRTRGLLPGSPAIDHGNPGEGGGVVCEPVDQTGAARPSGPACDVGAFEGTATLPISDAGAPEARPTEDAMASDAEGGSTVADAASEMDPAPTDATNEGEPLSPYDAGASGAPPFNWDAAVADAGNAPPADEGGGCGCRTAPRGAHGAGLALVAAALAYGVRRQRRRTPSR